MILPPEVRSTITMPATVTMLSPPALHARLLALAERDPRRAACVARGWFGDASASESDPWRAYTLGAVLLRWERVAEAREALNVAQATFVACDAMREARLCHEQLLVARQLAGEGETLQAAWHDLIEGYKADEAWSDAARASCEQIAHLNMMGRPREARLLADHSGSLIARAGSLATQARRAHVAGVAAGGCGDLDAADTALEQARSLFAQLGRPVDVARVLFERAWIWQRREQFTYARADLEQALAIFKRFDLPLRVALCYKDLGTTAGYVGDYATSLAYALQARSQFAALGRQDQVARCDLNLGAIAHYSGLFDLAHAAYARAQTVFATRGDWRLVAICGRNGALALCAQARPAEALAALDAIDTLVQTLGDKLEAAEAQAVRARALHDLGAIDAALACLCATHAQFVALGNQAAAAECLLEQGWLYIEQEQWQASADSLAAALPVLADRPAHRWRVLHGLGRVAQQQGDTLAALHQYCAAGALVATLRRKLASEHASSGIFVQAQRLYLDTMRLALQIGALEQVLISIEQQRSLVLQRQFVESSAVVLPDVQARRDQQRDHLRTLRATQAPPDVLDAALREYLDALLHARHLAPLATELPYVAFDLGAMRLTLTEAYGDDWTALVPTIVDDELLLITVTAATLSLTRTPYDAPLRQLLERASLPRYRLLTYRDLTHLRGQTRAAWSVLRVLAERLLPAEVRTRLHSNHRLLIVPFGPLHALPWAALRLDERWLCEQAIIQYLPSVTLPPTIGVKPQPHAPALLIGCETFGGRAAELPYARASLDLVEAYWAGATTRLEADAATRKTILDWATHGELGQYGLVHIASHASSGAPHGLLGHIKLADDDLLIDEVLRLNLRDALVVLAACEGAASEVLPGDEMLGISRALLAAGASTVVASIWPIYDHATLRALELFYGRLAAGSDPAYALTFMQRTMLSEVRSEHALEQLPYIWASFTCIGAPCGVEAGGTRPAFRAARATAV